MTQDNLTAKQHDYAVFLPAISGFYATYIGKQRDPVNGPYVDPTRMPAGMKEMEMMNGLNTSKGLFPYTWSLYSGGHANLDLTKQDWSEDMVRNREPGTVMLGDSGGFQIAKGLWEGEWRDPTSPAVLAKMAELKARGVEHVLDLKPDGTPKHDKNGNKKYAKIDHVKNYQNLLDAAQKKREAVLKWLDGIADYGMTLDIPTWVIHDKNASDKCGITTLPEAVEATKYNNDYYMKHRKGVKNGGMKVLNVLQGANHADADRWYDTMKHYCDPTVYPDTHFDGWSMGGQNMCDVHLVLRRLVALRHDGLLQEGVHDWMHFLGTSKLEWAVLLTDIQRAVRKYVNPSFTISFDCASPFLATANGQVYHHIDLPHNDKWCYRMSPIADDKKYSTDTRSYRDAVLQDGLLDSVVNGKLIPGHFDESPISQQLQMKDVCYYQPGMLNKIGKEGKTSWDSFSYALLMGHNVWMHLEAVQRANREYDAGSFPAMMWHQNGDHARFKDIVDDIFATSDRAEAEAIIEKYDRYWMDIIGTRGFKGKKAKNAHSQFNALFEEADVDNNDDDSVQLEEEFSPDQLARLDQLEQDQA
jgi:hypothetical protein